MNQSPISPRPAMSPADSPAAPLRVAVVAASWHRDIVQVAVDAAAREFASAALPPVHLTVHDVPGAFEIPLVAQALARGGAHDAVVACALVVDGGIYRHEFVAHAVIDGLMRVQLETGVPVFSAVLTPQQFHEHETHRAFFHAHFEQKGREVAQACVRTLALHAALRRAAASPAASPAPAPRETASA